MNLTIWTIGHSSLPVEAFLALLAHERIERLADVRRFPGSRAHPHFNQEALAHTLNANGIEYVPFPELGGRRRANAESKNTVWRHPAFRAYADFMDTPEFEVALQHLAEVAAERRTAIMCSEAVWWRCHRALIADVLKVRGARVMHIMSGPKVVEHPFTAAASIENGKLVYGAGKPSE